MAMWGSSASPELQGTRHSAPSWNRAASQTKDLLRPSDEALR